jgi:hypothetical protein
MLLISVCENGALGQLTITLYNLPFSTFTHCSYEVPFLGLAAKPR